MPSGVYHHNSQSEQTIMKRNKTIIDRYGGVWNKGLTSSNDDRVRKLAIGLRGHVVSEETRMKISKNSGSRRPEVKAKFRNNQLGKVASLQTREKQSLALRGPKSHLWRGGITSTYHKIRTSLQYRIWREAVFKRDRFACVNCGDKTGGNLNADHIKPFAYFPDLRLDIGNGRTLCVKCHKETETFGNRIRFNLTHHAEDKK